jgi:hypothetical protein
MTLGRGGGGRVGYRRRGVGMVARETYSEGRLLLLKEKKEEEEEVLASVIYSKGQLRFFKESWKCNFARKLRWQSRVGVGRAEGRAVISRAFFLNLYSPLTLTLRPPIHPFLRPPIPHSPPTHPPLALSMVKSI